MTTDSPATDPAPHDPEAPLPRVVVAMPDGSPVRQKVLRALRAAEVEVETVEPGEFRKILETRRADVVVVRRSQLPEDATDLLEGPEEGAPGLVVVAEEDDPVDRAELLAAGVSRVLDATGPADELGTMLETVAETEAEGGLDGPEIRGNTAQPKLGDFLSRSTSMKRFLDVANRVATADAPLLITGETGVGKERLARAIHAESSRAGQAFVSVNCGAMPEQLLESQLFGHERGAFTGADKMHRGFFEQAGGGTIFLDEVGEIPPHVQVKLLTVLQRHEVQRLGADRKIPVDVRVMAATNRDLRDAIDNGGFREDLYYRLNVISLEVPPLRERVDDIADLVGLLMQYFRGALEGCQVDSISEEAMQALMSHAWPGNVRELINAIERAMLLCSSSTIELANLPPELTGTAARSSTPTGEAGGRSRGDLAQLTLREVREAAVARAEREYLDAVLRESGGRINETAKRAGIGTRSLYDKMQRYGLRKEDYKQQT